MNDVLVSMSEKAASSVQDLIRLNIDSSEGFAASADLIEDRTLADLFREYSAQRADNAEELKASVAYNGDEPVDHGSTSGTLHRWWLELRGKVTGGTIHSVLSEAERGEDAIKHRYEEVLKECAGSPIADLLTTQYRGIKAAHDRVRDLRDASQPAK